MVRIQPADEQLILDDDLLVCGDNDEVLMSLPDGKFDLVYLDPPFNTGRAQTRQTLATPADETRRPARVRRAHLQLARC